MPILVFIKIWYLITARCYAECGCATVSRLFVRLSVRLSVRDVDVCFSLTLEYFENNFTAKWLKVPALIDPNSGDLVRSELPQNYGGIGWGHNHKNLQYL